MAIEFVETASSGDDSGGQHGAADDVMALTATMAALDDWATGDQEPLLGGGDGDDHAAAAWHMDSIDVASCFAGEPTHRSTSTSTSTSTLGPMAAALHGSDQLFGATLSHWWEHAIDGADTKPTAQAGSQYNPDKEVTDALLAVFAPHALVSDDSQTDSGTESGSVKLEQLRLSRSDSSVSNASSASATALPPRVPAGPKKGKGKARSASGQALVKQEIADDELGLTPLEIRRKRNRESMQRARRRQRDDVEEMKETLQELELHYQKLSEAAQERRSHGSGSGAGVAAAPTRESQRLEADYYAAADLSHSLKEEKFMLELMLTDKQKTFRRMQQVMVDRVQELELPCPTTTTPESLFQDFEFTPITEARANELIRQCYQMILQFQDTAAPLTPPRGMNTDAKSSSKPKAEGTLSTSRLPPAATFGWKVTCHVTPEQNFFVSFAKYFKGVSAEEAMLATWMRARNPHVNRNPNRRLYQYKVLQVINDSTYVAGMDIHHPVKKDKHMRNMFCRFRLQTGDGVYVIGRASLNPKSPELRRMAEEHATFEYVDNYSWIEFSSVVDKDTGESGVWVKFNARTEYNTQEDSHLRLVNSLYVTLKWESAVIPNAKTSFFLPS